MKKCTNPKRSPRKKIKLTAKGTEQKEMYKCKHCPKVFQHTASLYRHRSKCNASRLSEGKEPCPEKVSAPKEFVCTTCCKKFDRVGKLDKHMNTMHLGDNDKFCHKCGKKFKRVDYFQKHVLGCQGPDQTQPVIEEALGEWPSFAMSQEQQSVQEFPSFLTSEELHQVREDIDGDIEMTLDREHRDGDVDMHIDQDVTHEETAEADYIFTPDEIPVVFPNDFVPDLNSTTLGVPLPNMLSTVQDNSTIEQDSTTEQDSTVEQGSTIEQHSTVEQDSTIEQDSTLEQDSSLIPNYSNDYRNLLCEAVLNDLKENKSDSDYLFSNLFSYFGVQLANDHYLQKWLTKSLGMRKKRFIERLYKWLRPKIDVPKGKKRTLTDEDRQIIHDTYLENSTISVDRRDGRDMVRMRMSAYKEHYHGIETSLVSAHVNNRKTLMAQAPRYMCHVTTKKIVEILQEKHNLKVSIGTAHSLRPFFVDSPTDREKLECLCTVCCNARTLFDAIQRRAKKNGMVLYTSITSYLTSGKDCIKDKNGYISRPCITGCCTNCSGIVNPHPYSFKKDDVVTYYQFELVSTGKLDKNGRPKKKTQRNDYNSVPTSSVVTKLNDMAKRYLLHRFDVSNDKFVWPLIQTRCDEAGEHIVHMDYSENLKEKPKKETQPHHFSGQQHSLHCSVVQTPQGNIYFYHFSNEKVHNWRFTKAVVMDLLDKVFKDVDTIRIKTDNCTTQYKCLHIFAMYTELAKGLKIKIIIYFGAAGHCRGLVDGMSSWGLKTHCGSKLSHQTFGGCLQLI